jgi:hypothetical protein
MEAGTTRTWSFTALMGSGQVLRKTGSLLTETATLLNASFRLIVGTAAALTEAVQPLRISFSPLAASAGRLAPGFAVEAGPLSHLDCHLNSLLFSPAPGS